MKEKHNYTVQTYLDTTDEEYKIKESETFFNNNDTQYYVHEIRRKLEDGNVQFLCGFCKHSIRICGGQGDKKQAFHFKHYKGGNKGCIYEDDNRLSKDEVLRIKYNGAKESLKHEQYKNFVAERLLAMIDPKLSADKVLVEKIFRNKSVPREWRKPDVLAIFPDKTIAFELQLSTTFLSVIAAREAFYQKQQIFILWIFDSFSEKSKEQLFTQKDILVSNVYNVFVLDEEAIERSIKENTIFLRCYYVKFRKENGKILDDKMVSELIPFSELKFRKEDYKVFYRDAIADRNQLEIELKMIQKSESFFDKDERDKLERIRNYGDIIDDSIANGTVQGFINYYYNQYFSAQKEITNIILNRYKQLFFYQTEIDINRLNFYLYLFKNSSVWFDIGLFFRDNMINLLSFTNIEHEKDSRQFFYSEVIYYLFKTGYNLSNVEKDAINERLVELKRIIEKKATQEIKNEMLRYSLLLCYLRIQNEEISPNAKLSHYNLLHDHWTEISRIASIQMNFIIGCDLANMAAVFANAVIHQLNYSHLFILAAESENGKKNVYKGKKGDDHLMKLKDAMRTKSKYTKEENLDKLIAIIFPKLVPKTS